jgi:hypothetical protein
LKKQTPLRDTKRKIHASCSPESPGDNKSKMYRNNKTRQTVRMISNGTKSRGI